MKHLLTAFACCLAVAGSAQSDAYPFNPDSDGDGIIGVEDLLALLSDFGMEAVVETCFKGNICVYNANGGNENNSEPNCGTIIGKTWNWGGGGLNIIHLTNEGYSQGDVIHVYHHKDNCNYESLYIKTLSSDSWTTCWVSSSCTGPVQASLIFNGQHWEQLD